MFDDYVEMIKAVQPDIVAICTAACLPKLAQRCPDDLSRPDAHADLCVAVSNLGVPSEETQYSTSHTARHYYLAD
eukprot:COSAG06_NODE_1057_length_10905_cov_6.405793_12_plen_75_part_00